MLSPTSELPPIKCIRTTSLDKLQSSIHYLSTIYNPPVRGSLRRRRSQLSPGPLVADVRTDVFERAYSTKWLTTLIAQLGSDSYTVDGAADRLVASAAALLATCAGTASAGTIDRTFVFTTTDSNEPTADRPNGSFYQTITVKLKDVPLDNHDYRSVGAQTWGSACIMADMIAENPSSFGIPDYPPSHASSSAFSFRCLELGAGTGLVSLSVAKILQLRLTNSNTDLPVTPPDIEIIPSDVYPSVLSNLERNICANFTDTSPPSPLHIHSHPLDWSAFSQSETVSDPAVLQKRFDVIYGADIVYEARHAQWIKGCLLKLLKKPGNGAGDEDPAFHLIIPLRKTHTAESSTIEQVFGDNGSLVIKRKEMIVCESETGSVDEVEYVYYRIGWEI